MLFKIQNPAWRGFVTINNIITSIGQSSLFRLRKGKW